MSDRTPPAWLVTLADFATHTPLSALSPAALHKARWVLADCIPVIAAGMAQAEMKTFVERHLEGRVAFLWERRAVRFHCQRLLLLGVWPGLPGTLLGDPLPPERELRWPHQSRGLGGDGSQPTEGV